MFKSQKYKIVKVNGNKLFKRIKKRGKSISETFENIKKGDNDDDIENLIEKEVQKEEEEDEKDEEVIEKTNDIEDKEDDDNYDEDDEEAPTLGYYNVIIGDYGIEQETYTLDDEQE